MTGSIKRNKAGFTFLEIMVALSVMAIVLLAVYGLHSQTVFMGETAKFQTIAPLLAEKIVSRFEIDDGEFSSGSGKFEDPGFSSYQWRLESNEVFADVLGQGASDLKQIDITIFDKENAQQFLLKTYRLIPGES